MHSNAYKILEEKNVIDDHFLDIIGNEFKFDHEKGIAEWFKNSVDAYIRNSIPDSEQYLLLRFTDSDNNKALIECIDFNGMTSLDIDKAVKRWGDPEAAKRGLTKKVYGGHGNGGKFYMRQMFNASYFVTYKNGLMNIFGFNENKKYGFADGFKNRALTVIEALRLANIKTEEIPSSYKEAILSGKCGFTLVKGIAPVGMKNKIKYINICEKIKKHPQAMRLLDRTKIIVKHDDKVIYNFLKPNAIAPLKDFETPTITEIPDEISWNDNGEIIKIQLSNRKYSKGRLVLKTSEMAFTGNSKYAELNRIDIIGEIGVLASYPLREFGIYYPTTDFIYGECECPMLENPEDDCVMNDRSRLADNLKTRALREWIKSEIEKLCREISSKEQKEREEINKKLSSDYNNFLNQWKNRFMSKLMGEILVGPGDGSGVGLGQGGLSKEHNGHTAKENNSDKGTEDQGGGNTPKKGNRFPMVLLSGLDYDPLNPGQKLPLQPGHGLIYQRPQDVKEGIYWINTSSPLAESILKRYDANSARWRDYLFQRYVDIFIKEALFKLEKTDPERFSAFTIDGDILGKMVLKIHEAAASDLESFLFADKYEAANTTRR